MGTTSTPPTTTARAAGWVAALCWTAVLLDGFDLVVVGTVLPALSRPEEWGLSPSGATFVITIGLVGMTIGALIGAVTSFSLFTLRCAVAPDAGVFGLLRFLAGVGLGGCLPTAIVMVNEFTRRKAGRATTTMMTGYHVGAVLTAGLAIAVGEPIGWRWMFVIGAAPAAVLVPLMVRQLPESPAYLIAHGPRAEAEDIAREHGLELEAAPPLETGAGATVRTLFTGGRPVTTVALGVTSFMGLLLVHGLNSWLPTIMREADYDLDTSLAFLLVLDLGAIAGLLVAGTFAERVGPRTAGIVRFAAGAVFRALLSVKLPIAGSYVMVFQRAGAGLRVHQRQPPAAGACHGAGLGVGRRAGGGDHRSGDRGALLSAGYAFPWGFYVFAVVGALGALALAVTRVREDRPATI